MQPDMPMTSALKISAAALACLVAGVYGIAGERRASVETEPATLRGGFAVGDVLLPEQIHLIDRPGLYGLGLGVPGSRYAVADGKLIRVEEQALKVQSILRSQAEILD